MYLTKLRMIPVLIAYLVAQVKAYPMQTWPVYQAPREYADDDYYYTPKVQYYYDSPVAVNVPEVYGQIPYPYYYDPYAHIANESPKRHEERLAALPIGQETWFESETTPRWRSNDVDDVSAAFLDNLILTQMAQDAQRRRENARAAFPPVDYDEQEHEPEDEDVRELKALAGKPMYHVPKTVPRFDDDDYQAEDSFINWDGNKRSVTVAPPTTTTFKPGQKEIVVPRPAQHHEKRNSNYYDTVARLLASKSLKSTDSAKSRRIDKRFVAMDHDLVQQLRGLKNRIAT